MNSFKVTHEQAKSLLLGDLVKESSGEIDLEAINDEVKVSRKNYDFTKVNIKNTPNVFASERNIKSCNLNVIDLFCGAGGSSSGFRLAGFNLVGALDNNAKAAATHALNFPTCKTIVGDITKITPEEFHKLIGEPRVDIVIGSPPCQTFSSLSQGKIKSLGKDIKEDIRNYFYKNYLEYIEYYKPKIFLMENLTDRSLIPLMTILPLSRHGLMHY